MSQEIVEVRQYHPTGQVRVLIEDLAQAICHAANCYNVGTGGGGDVCGHQRVATEMVNATIDHYIDVYAKDGNHDAADLLRNEM